MLLSSLAYAVDSAAAGFDCEQALSPTEKLICHDETLSTMDEELNDRYKKALADPLLDSESLKSYQRSFIKLRNQCIKNSDDIMSCISESYYSALQEYNRLPREVKVRDFEKKQGVLHGWQKITAPAENASWPYLISIYMPPDDNGLWHDSDAYLVMQDKLTEITRQVFYIPKVIVSLDEKKVSTADVDYNVAKDKTNVLLSGPDRRGRFSIVISCGDMPRYTYHHLYFITDSESGKFIFHKNDDCGNVK
jgi:uncharacterized protein YecT (DUF1311 family)